MKKAAPLLILIALLSFFNAKADDGSSGCGVGWMILKDNSLISSSFRSMTNGTFSNTIGMTLGTSGCAKHKIVKNEELPVYFANANFDQLTLDMSKGDGPYLATLAYTLGCQDVKTFSTAVQENFRTLASLQNGADLVAQIKSDVVIGRQLNCLL